MGRSCESLKLYYGMYLLKVSEISQPTAQNILPVFYLSNLNVPLSLSSVSPSVTS